MPSQSIVLDALNATSAIFLPAPLIFPKCGEDKDVGDKGEALASRKCKMLRCNNLHFDFLVMKSTMAKSPVVVNLIPIEATSETFADYGQIIEASRDGELFGPNDAQLDLSRGTPRLYIMPLKDTSFGFSKITHHAHVTQCLGSIGAHDWYVGVAKASLVENDDERRVDTVESSFGHLYNPPKVEEVRVFRVSGTKFVKYNRGTWHVGPLFRESSMDFYNLELSDTDVTDETTYDFKKNNGAIFRFEPKDDTSS